MRAAGADCYGVCVRLPALRSTLTFTSLPTRAVLLALQLGDGRSLVELDGAEYLADQLGCRASRMGRSIRYGRALTGVALVLSAVASVAEPALD